jgi:hypothetical protein
LDHFHPPLRDERHWEGFHSRWANALVDALNEELLPPGYYAEATIHFGANVEIDAATFQRGSSTGPANGPTTATLPSMPLALAGGPTLPVDLESAYSETRTKLRLSGER